MICAACQRKKQGMSTEDQHHPQGEANGAFTVSVPVNDHRAELTPDQQDWPKETRENLRGSPLLKGAAHVRGFIDTIYNFVKRLLGWIPEMLEQLDERLTTMFGDYWWNPLGFLFVVPA
jgi:hypothetical protein